MMSYKQWFVLLMIYIIFMLAGSVVFMKLEINNELDDRQSLQDLKKKVINVVSNLENDSRADVTEVVKEMSDNCKHDFLHLVEDAPLTWSLWNSFFFTFTVITTIGFGHMSPSTAWGKVFCILYATVGVPLNGILIASLADLFSSKIVNSRVRAKAKRYQSWKAVAADATLYLLPGFIIFLVLPAAVLVAVEEGWDYLDSFYYAFITLTTIGFGDYVAGLQETDYVLVWLYKIISFIWIIFGLGYIIMSITFIQKALKCKKIHTIEQRLARGLKKHANRMNTNVHHDLKRLRAVVNTLSVIQAESGQSEDEKHGNEGNLQRSIKQLSHQLAIQTESKPNDRVFLSHNNTPTQKRHKVLQIKRSASDAAVGPADKSDSVLQPSSLENINIFLDMVETLLREHEDEAAKRADDDAHNIVQNAVHSDSTSDEEPCDTSSADRQTKDLESGFVNKAFIDDDDKVTFDLKDELPKKAMKSEEDNNARLQRKLSSLLGLPELSNSTALPKTATPGQKVKTFGDFLGLMESIVCTPVSENQRPASNRKFSRQFSSSVPGHYRKKSENSRPHLLDTFQIATAENGSQGPHHSCSSSSNQDTINSDSSLTCRRRWSFCHPSLHMKDYHHQYDDTGDDDVFKESEDSKIPASKLFLKWIQSDSDLKTKSKSEESTPDYTRL